MYKAAVPTVPEFVTQNCFFRIKIGTAFLLVLIPLGGEGRSWWCPHKSMDRGVSNAALFTFEARPRCCGELPWAFRVFRCILGLYPLDTSSIPPTVNQRVSADIAKCPLGAKCPSVEKLLLFRDSVHFCICSDTIFKTYHFHVTPC